MTDRGAADATVELTSSSPDEISRQATTGSTVTSSSSSSSRDASFYFQCAVVAIAVVGAAANALTSMRLPTQSC